MDLLESERNQEKEQKLKQEIMQLQTKANKLQTKTDNLKKDVIRNINGNRNDGRGQLTPVKVLSTYNINKSCSMRRLNLPDIQIIDCSCKSISCSCQTILKLKTI